MLCFSPESVFGSTLAELKAQEKTNIPIFVLHCIQHIEKSEENMVTDGLYRISGNAAQIQKIRFEVRKLFPDNFLLVFNKSLFVYSL